jgi:tripartite-type tricarboxylate transporter receptor subunit TctC
MIRTLARIACAVLIALGITVALSAQEPFYKGKTITIIQGREPGGTGDMRVKAVIPYLRKYIPGEPNIVSEYVAGAGGRKAANTLYRSVKPDGLTIANVGAGLVTNAVLGEPGVQYEIDKLIYLGAPNSATHYVFLSRREAGLNSLAKLSSATGVRVGAQSVGHDIYINGRLFAYLLNLKEPKFITGYSGPELDIALMRGELDARANIADTILQRTPEWVEKKLTDFHAIVEIPKGDTHPHFKYLPELETFAKSDREKKVLTMFRTFRLLGSPYILPPGTPKEQVEILREALRKTFKDPEFHKDFKKLTGDDPTPLTAEKIHETIRELPREPTIVELFKKLASGDPLPPR